MPEIKEKSKETIKQLDKNIVQLQKLKNNIVTTKEKINEFTKNEQNDTAENYASMKVQNDLSYLYSQGDSYVFMDNNTYDQIEINKSKLGDNAKFLKEGLVVNVMDYNGEIVGVTFPDKISYKVVETEMAVKGNTTSGAQKDAVLETGYVVKVPLFIEAGEEIIITTSDGKYSSRA